MVDALLDEVYFVAYHQNVYHKSVPTERGYQFEVRIAI